MTALGPRNELLKINSLVIVIDLFLEGLEAIVKSICKCICLLVLAYLFRNDCKEIEKYSIQRLGLGWWDKNLKVLMPLWLVKPLPKNTSTAGF